MIDWVMRTEMNQLRAIQWTLMTTLDGTWTSQMTLLCRCTPFSTFRGRTDSLQTTARDIGLQINAEKSTTMRINTNQAAAIHFGDHNIADVSKFTYPGSIINKTGDTDEDIKARINKARLAFAIFTPIW